MLTFQEIRKQNLSRANDWIPISSWSIMEWACAMAGEAGELCNVAKKIHRIETNVAKRKKEIGADLMPNLAEEAADVFIYLDLLCASRDLDVAIIKKFGNILVPVPTHKGYDGGAQRL